MLTAITKNLASIAASGSFATRRPCPPDDLQLTVRGVGPIRFPISGASARTLCTVARPARFGYKQKTLRDQRVRNTWEIGKDRITIAQERWQPALSRHLAKIQQDLGLPAGCSLTADLHNLLIYEPGQFFVPHQDSEKLDGMVGTLVVTLPSPFQGGAIVIEHHGKKVSYRGSGAAMSLIAFYADCHHEVQTVTSGHRIVVTYNLLLHGSSDLTDSPQLRRQTELLATSIRSHFDTPLPPRWEGQPPQAPPDRLVYLLDHHYTQKSLGWKRLKNGDAIRVRALRDVAMRLECEIFLALADVHETWSCEDDEDDHERYRHGWHDEDESEDDEEESQDDDDLTGSGASWTLTDLEDSDVELRHWLDASGRRTAMVPMQLGTYEVCATTDSDALEPFATEHEGYMGNYGNTVDRWYHRAAVVLWPRDRTFLIRARLSAAYAIDQIGTALKAGSLDEARTLTRRVAPFWSAVAPREEGRRFIRSTLQVADAIEEADLAATLLQPLTPRLLSAATARLVRTLLQRYGLEWCRTLFANGDQDRRDDERLAWIASMPGFSSILCADASVNQRELVRSIATSELAWLTKEFATQCRLLPGQRPLAALDRLLTPLLGLLETSMIAKSPELRSSILGLLSIENRQLLSWVMRFLRIARGRHPPREMAELGLGLVQESCNRALIERLAAPPRRPGDWSVVAPRPCGCELCTVLNDFLTAPGRKTMDWRLATQGRAHIHRIVADHDLPIQHVTIRSGSPRTLVLTKKPAVFVQAAAERESWTADLRWLKKELHIR